MTMANVFVVRSTLGLLAVENVSNTGILTIENAFNTDMLAMYVPLLKAYRLSRKPLILVCWLSRILPM